MKLSILTSHPIQYQTPFFKKIASLSNDRIDLHVYFSWKSGIEGSFDEQFGTYVKWDIQLLDGFLSTFINNYSPKKGPSFWGQINPGIIRHLIRDRPDALLVYGWNAMTNWIAIFSAKILGIPILLHGESSFIQEQGRHGIGYHLRTLCLRILFSQIDAFLYIGENNRKFYLSHLGERALKRLFFVPYAVENERFFLDSQNRSGCRGIIRAEYGIQDDECLFLFTGKLSQKKRPFDILAAFQKIQLQKTHLFFVGTGELLPSLRHHVSRHQLDTVHFLGFQNQTLLANWYLASDVFILPSDANETWGLVINEAMCFSLPILASDRVGCVPDLVHSGENGYIFPCGDVDALANSMKKLADSKTLRRELGKNSLNRIQSYSHNTDIFGLQSALLYITGHQPAV